MFSWKPSLDERKREELHKTVLEKGREKESGRTTHGLEDEELRTVFATAQFLTEDGYMQQVAYDLKVAEYRIFDWIAMLLNGRDQGNDRLTQVMASAYLRSNDVDGFVRNLRRKDYQVEEPILEPILEGDGDADLDPGDKKELLEEARNSPKIDGGEWFSEVYGRKLPIDAVKGLCPACKEPICDDEIADTIDQDLAARKDNYCGYCGYESGDEELVKTTESAE